MNKYFSVLNRIEELFLKIGEFCSLVICFFFCFLPRSYVLRTSTVLIGYVHKVMEPSLAYEINK